MELFYAPPDTYNAQTHSLALSGDDAHHAVTVLRKKVGDELRCIDGTGRCFVSTVSEVSKGTLYLAVREILVEPPPKTHLSVAISLTKTPERFENFLEKSTELGVSEIIPMITTRTVSRPKPAQFQAKHARWQKILISACKQSQRFRFPHLHTVTHFADVLKRTDDVKVIPYEFSKEPIRLSFAGKRVLFVIGGEGGFTPEEVDAARRAGFQEISLGETILRVDTAGLFVVSMVRAEELRQT
jgi:16S rRNA (uracil1498-N3)-methyltransferase